MEGRAQGITPAEVKQKLDRKDDFVLLDVRGHGEHEKLRIEAPQVNLIPQPVLTKNMETLPKDREIVTMCRRGGRAYQSACILKGQGYKDVKFMEGSLTCWCGDACGKPLL
jgi:rhodanese-related sulfurtransferase